MAHGLLSVDEFDQLQAQREEATAEHAATVDRVQQLEADAATLHNEGEARLAAIDSEIADLRAQIEHAVSELERLDLITAEHQIRASTDGLLGHVETIRPGSFVDEGDLIAALVPAGQLRIVGQFPADGIGRIRSGQSARLRLDAFPWLQHGELAATVLSVWQRTGRRHRSRPPGARRTATAAAGARTHRLGGGLDRAQLTARAAPPGCWHPPRQGSTRFRLMGRQRRRSVLVPEVVQTSAMDCGPAALKAVLDGFGIWTSYGRLREACHTDVDGTSIDTLAEIANQLGLDAEQIMIPADHVLLSSANALPALAVITRPNGFAHFVVLWRTHGPLVQVMDPATGRRWVTRRQLLDELLVHTHQVPAAGWREWAGSAEAVATMREQLAAIGATRTGEQLLDAALGDPGWRSLAALDAAVRMVTALVRTGAVVRGREATQLLSSTLERPDELEQLIPQPYWSVSPAGDHDDQLLLRGAVLVRFKDRRPIQSDEAGALPQPRLASVLCERRPRPGRELWRLLAADGLLAPVALLVALSAAAAGVIVEALLYRSVIDIGTLLNVPHQRATAILAISALLALQLLLDLPIAATALRAGRRLEARLRIAFQRKIPRLGDRYFRSRLSSDMAERAHSVHAITNLPTLGSRLVRTVLVLCCTVAGIVWLDPRSAPVAFSVALLSVAVPMAAQTILVEKDLRRRTHGAALGRFYLDALLGLMPIRSHTAERPVRREHESLLVEWARSGLELLRGAMLVEGLLGLLGICLVMWLLADHLLRVGASGMVLLLVYWALELPALGRQIAMIARQYPAQRNITLRMLEPLGAPEDEAPEVSAPPIDPAGAPASLELAHVDVRAAGQTILHDLHLRIEPGTHVAVVGRSGAGKSSFLALILGLLRPSSGAITVDGKPLSGATLQQLRASTAWVDPTVQLWNRSLLENLRYGNGDDSATRVAEALESAGLYEILDKLPDGLQTVLGEGGALLSGGEGQRVRLGRSWLRSPVTLALLDEPFRGLARTQRQLLLANLRHQWRAATLVCVTHDLGETESFDRVVVMDAGRVVEHGTPQELLSRTDSHYRRLYDAEQTVRLKLWDDPSWRRWHLDNGRLETEAP